MSCLRESTENEKTIETTCANLEDGGEDGADKLGKLLGEDGGQINEHHDVAVAYVGRYVGAVSRLYDLINVLFELAHTESTNHLTQALRGPRSANHKHEEEKELGVRAE